MCGVIGLILERDSDTLGTLAASLLKTLEYRGYDSAGAAIQSSDGELQLRKGVGAPSVICEPLGITAMKGRVFTGQVRWATFGAVDDVNAQPHAVDCFAPLFGAHNGNVTNCDDLQTWLRSVGHDVKSDNDGEMVVHTIEHCFAAGLAERPEAERDTAEVRRAVMREAIVEAGHRLEGSYAAVVVDRVSQVLWAIKAGSSLYAGVGEHPEHGPFAIASSDLSGVLQTTHQLIPLARGEFIELTAAEQTVYELGTGERLERSAKRSLLVAPDTELRPPFETFIAQEIAAQPQAVRDVLRAFRGGSERAHALRATTRAWSDEERAEFAREVHAVRSAPDDGAIVDALLTLAHSEPFRSLRTALGPSSGGAWLSAERSLLERLAVTTDREVLATLDGWVEREETDRFGSAVDTVLGAIEACNGNGGRLYAVGCGSSYHAAMIGSLLFAEIAATPWTAVTPGEFRARYMPALGPHDLVLAVTQSGETKDLVDVLTELAERHPNVARYAIANNGNSTVALDLVDAVVPLLCGPETAVAATKSFVNEVAVFHGLACALGERTLPGRPDAEQRMQSLRERKALLARVPGLLEQTLETTADAVEAAADLLALAPSAHVLATRVTAVALEGALKIREIVINHTQGYEAAEFKHGPNTILGRNTVYGPREIAAALDAGASARRSPFNGNADLAPHLDADHPLIYVSGPDARDVALTISQVNTHKIRGAMSIAIAEEDAGLRQAITKAPAGNAQYRSLFIPLPRTGDFVATLYTATVVLQRLALRMSERKRAFLDDAGIANHGVHPDVPKNVSKSITVD